MKSEWRIFGLVAAFLFVACIVYAWWSWQYSTPHHVEWVGTVALVLSGLLCTMCGGYFLFVSRRIELRPEDRDDAEIADGAGDVGFFSPGSYWPIGIALCAGIAGIGIAYWTIWIIVLGLVFTVAAAAALIFEYYTGTRRAH
jgi:Cytochrome c oxidase subunit IV